MNARIFKTAAVVFCLAASVGCAVPRPQAPIINPRLIDEKAAKEQLLPRYSSVVAKADRTGFEVATTLCRRVQRGEVNLAAAKSSPNGRYSLYLFQEKDAPGSTKGAYAVIAFYFNPGSELVRSCNQAGLCDVHVRNGMVRYGHTDVRVQGEPTVTDNGITMTFSEVPRAYAFDLLFSYGEKDKRDGDELIALFLSAFPFLYYQ